MNEVLVLYYSRQGSTAALARQICRGVEAVPRMQARLRTVAPVTATTQSLDPPVPDEGPPYGASHVAALTQHGELSEHESALARALGTRVAALAAQLATRA